MKTRPKTKQQEALDEAFLIATAAAQRAARARDAYHKTIPAAAPVGSTVVFWHGAQRIEATVERHSGETLHVRGATGARYRLGFYRVSEVLCG